MIGIRVKLVEICSNRVKLDGGTSMWPRTDFLELLGITHPIIQAPMTGFAPPALAAAVCNAGGLGSIGCAGIPPATVRDQVSRCAKRQIVRTYLNFFVHAHPRLDPRCGGPNAGEALFLFRRIRAGAGS